MVHGLASQETSVVLLIMKQLSRCVLDDELAMLVTQRNMVSHVLVKLDSELVIANEVGSDILAQIQLLFAGDRLVCPPGRDSSRVACTKYTRYGWPAASIGH